MARTGLVSKGVFILAVVGFLSAGVGAFQWSAWRRREDGRSLWWAVNAVRHAESEFAARDLDGNGVPDYWTGDVAGLLAPFIATPGNVLGPEAARLARADAAPLAPRTPVPFHGYYVVVVRWDRDGSPFQVDTDGSGARTHHRTEFAFCFYPVVYSDAPGQRDTWFITSVGRFRSDTRGMPVLCWPSDDELRMKWGRCC
jgi:hypothetical protein